MPTIGFAMADSPDAHVVCDCMPEPHHEAFENVLNGGIIGTVLDCHMNWTAIFHLMKKHGLDHAPCCVTAELKVVLEPPTPLGLVDVDAHVVSSSDDRANVEATMTAAGKVTAIGTGTFIAVKPHHPAFRRWTSHGPAASCCTRYCTASIDAGHAALVYSPSGGLGQGSRLERTRGQNRGEAKVALYGVRVPSRPW